MTIKDQLEMVKENWLIALLLIMIVMLPLLSSPAEVFQGLKMGQEMMASDAAYGMRTIMPYPGEGFAPEEAERKITKTSSLSTEVEKGAFFQVEEEFKAILFNEMPRPYAASLLINENIQKYGAGRREYYSGSYTLKVDVRGYDIIISQLKEIGEVQSFSENQADITGSYTTLAEELKAERARLARYHQMLAEAASVADKIELNDRIFNQERTIQYLEKALKNQDEQVSYATIYLQITEKQSEFVNVALVGFGQLATSLVNSLNSLLQLLFAALPYALAAGIVWLIVRAVKRKK